MCLCPAGYAGQQVIHLSIQTANLSKYVSMDSRIVNVQNAFINIYSQRPMSTKLTYHQQQQKQYMYSYVYSFNTLEK